MIVYRERRTAYDTARVLERMEQLCSDAPDALLVEFGELEAGLADALCPAYDDALEILECLREACVAGARSICHARLGTERYEYWLSQFRQQIISLRAKPLPRTFRASVPEGFAYYALYPELYFESARRFAEEYSPKLAAVIGIRSIGTTLSAAVAAVLRESGCHAPTWTVRPRGHPFDRSLAVSAGLEGCWKALAGAWFLVVDEGPGLSGSSLASVAKYLTGLGIPEERIVFFPSWVPDGSSFVSDSARAQWRRHRKYCTQFEQLWPFEGEVELSAGKWRELLYPNERLYPAVQIQHERRKYLRKDGRQRLLKFAGLGRYGAAKFSRAASLAEAGFAPEPLFLENGFLGMRFIDGSPVSSMTQRLLEQVVAYLHHLNTKHVAGEGVPWSDLMEMIETNVAEGLGEYWKDRLSPLTALRDVVCSGVTVAVDGRMLPHEWIQTSTGYCKTDGLDHHDDHFFPGPQDVAWDAAGAIAEFDLDTATGRDLSEKLESLSGDYSLHRRLPFYSVAYLSYRLGYATMAQRSLGHSPDGRRFGRLRERYAVALRRQLESLSPNA